MSLHWRLLDSRSTSMYVFVVLDLEFTRTLRDSLPAVPGLFLEIHGMRQACWRRRVGGVRKHYSFKQHGGFFEGRLQALQVSMTMCSTLTQSTHPQRVLLTMIPGGGLQLVPSGKMTKSTAMIAASSRSPGYGYTNRYLPSGFSNSSRMMLPPAMVSSTVSEWTGELFPVSASSRLCLVGFQMDSSGSPENGPEEYHYTDQTGGLKRKPNGGVLSPFPKRRMSMTANTDDEGNAASLPWLNASQFLHNSELEEKPNTDLMAGLLYSTKEDQYNGDLHQIGRGRKELELDMDGGTHLNSESGMYGISALWGTEGRQEDVVDTNGADEPRCAICCEFVTKRSSHVCTCQIPSCSRYESNETPVCMWTHKV